MKKVKSSTYFKSNKNLKKELLKFKKEKNIFNKYYGKIKTNLSPEELKRIIDDDYF